MQPGYLRQHPLLLIFKGGNVVSKLAALATFVALLSGCASQSSAIIVGTARPASSPESVKLYIDPPKRFEKIAMVQASSRAAAAWSEQAKTDAMIERLKEAAAKVGANGVLLQQSGDQSGGAVMPTTIYRPATPGGPIFGTGFAVPITHKVGNGIAIFVEEE